MIAAVIGIVFSNDVIILFAEAVCIYMLVLWIHSLQPRTGRGPFYALLGSITALMAWVTDAGVQVHIAGITFMVGSTVFYTSLLIGVFVVYVFDGPQPTRIAILTVAGISTLVPVVAYVLNAQMQVSGYPSLNVIPMPSLRINTASVLTTIADLFFLAMAWEFLGKPFLKMKIWLRTFLTFLGVMWFDVILFSTGAFVGTPVYLSIMGGTFLSRFIVALLLFPFLYAYMNWQSRQRGAIIVNRPVLAILREVSEVRTRLDVAQQEIERRKKAEAALRESQERLDLAVKSAYIGLWDQDFRKGSVTRNRLWAEMLGYTLEEIDSNFNGFVELVHPDDKQKLKRAIEEHENGKSAYFSVELRMKTKDHQWKWILNVGKIVKRDEHGKPLRAIGVHIDINEIKRLQDKLLQTQKLQAVGELAGGVAHDYNNLLTVINGYTEMLLSGMDPNHSDYGKLKSIEQAGQRAASLTNQLLAFSRKQFLKPQIINLNDLIENTMKMLNRLIGEAIELETRLSDKDPVIKADYGQIQQIIINLAINARDAMPDGGNLIITTQLVYRDNVEKDQLDVVQPGYYAVIAMTDTGIGMDEYIKNRIFEPFFTTKDVGKGTGLGLSTVYGILKQSGGDITVESAPHKGTTFKLFLPAIVKHGESSTEHPEPNKDLAGNETLLVVEDEKSVRDIVVSSLEQYGYHIIQAENGPEAIKKAKAAREPVHLLLSDVVMPEMSGFELSKKICELYPEVRVCFMSGYADGMIDNHDMVDEEAHFIQKPFSTQALVSKIREILDSHDDDQ